MEIPVEFLVSQLADVGVKSKGRGRVAQSLLTRVEVVDISTLLLVQSFILFFPPFPHHHHHQYIDICSLHQKIQNIMRIGFCIGHFIAFNSILYGTRLAWPGMYWLQIGTWHLVPV